MRAQEAGRPEVRGLKDWTRMDEPRAHVRDRRRSRS